MVSTQGGDGDRDAKIGISVARLHSRDQLGGCAVLLEIFSDFARVYRRQWWRLGLVQFLVLLAMSAGVGVVALIVQQNGASLLAWISADPDGIEARATGLATIAIAAIALIAVPMQLAGVVATVRIADRAITGDTVPRRLLAEGMARFLSLLGAAAVSLIVVSLAIIAVPLLVVVGLLGMLATAVLALIRRRAPGAVGWWPALRVWVFIGIPFAVLWWVAAPAILLPIAVVLERVTPLAGARAAVQAATGRRWLTIGLWLAAVIVALGVSLVGTLLGSIPWGEPGAALLGGLVQFFAVPAPVVAAVALYRRAAGPSGRVLVAAAPAVRATAIASPTVARVVIIALVASVGLVVGPSAATPAEAAESVAGQNVSYVVTSGTDTTDGSTLGSQAMSCLDGGADCTIRAAVALAQQDAADGALSVTIGFGSALDITLVAPLTFSPDAVAPQSIVAGTLAIDAGGHRVVLDGDHATQILSVTSEHWNLAIAGLTFTNAHSSGMGAALMAGVPSTQLAGTTFESNTASGGAGAVFARQLDVASSTFIDNHAIGFSFSTRGGAIRATGRITLENTTFGGNGVGDDFSHPTNQGGDVYADAGVDVVNSSFVNSQGGALAAEASSTVRNSLFTTNWTHGGLMCSGSFTGGDNLSAEGDSSCPGTTSTNLGLAVIGARSDSGSVPVYPLTLNGNPAIGAGTDCPAVDSLGTDRPADGCDLGAVEFAGQTSVELTVEPSAALFAAATFRATVTSAFGSVPQGSVTFTVDGVDHGPFSIDSLGVAEVALTGIDAGEPIDYSARFTADAPYDDSMAGPFQYTVEQVQVPVSLSCAGGTDADCGGTPWSITDTESIDLVASVDDDRDGTVVIALDAAGTSTVAGPTAVADGTVAFTIDPTDLGLGQRELWAIYESDDHEHAGISEARPISVLLTPTVTLTTPGSSAVFGDLTAGQATVTVTGTGPIPTGTVTVRERTGILDADGIATVDLSDLDVADGISGLVAQYSGDGSYGDAASNTVQFETTAAGTSTEITAISPAHPSHGQDVVVTVTVTADSPSTADPQGFVRLQLGSEVFGPATSVPDDAEDGVHTSEVVIPSSALDPGTHTITAQSSGNSNFEDSASEPTTFLISTAPTSTTLTVSPAPAAWGEQVLLTAEVDATQIDVVPGGTVRFSRGSSSLGTATLSACAAPNTAGCAVATLSVDASTIGLGVVTLSAEYLGSSTMDSSSDAVTTTAVVPAAPTVTINGPGLLVYGVERTYDVTVATNSSSPVDGTNVAITAVPESGASIPLGSVALSAGTGSIETSTADLLPGTYAIEATFAGDSTFTAASGSTPLVVTAATTDIDLDSLSATTVDYGGSLRARITVTNPTGTLAPEGDVVLSWMGHEVGRATLDSSANTSTSGVRTLDIDALFGSTIVAPDTFWLTARFEAGPGFADDELTTDAQEERRQVTVKPLQAEVAVEATAVIGQDVQATATVTIPGAPSGMTAKGWVQFWVTKSGAGQVGPIGPVAVVNGQATLPAGTLVNLGGSWIVRATYSKDDSDLRYVVTVPNNTATDQVDLDAASAYVSVDAPATAEYGVPMTVGVTVSGATVPSGKVRVQLAGVGNAVVSDEVDLVDGSAQIPVDLSSSLQLGSHDLVVYYSGDGALDSAKSDPFTVVVGGSSTTVTVGTSSRVVALYPGIVGATVEYAARVVAASGVVPFGVVRFFRDTTLIGFASLDADGVASISTTADVAWSGTITAEFQTGSSYVKSSVGTLTHSWVPAPTAATISGPAFGTIGVPANYTVSVAFDPSSFPFLPERLWPAFSPAGEVTVADTDGAQCTFHLARTSSSAHASTGSCELPFTSVGQRKVTASHAGDGLYPVGATASTFTQVAKGTPHVEIGVTDSYWMGLSTIPVSWRVSGPTAGTGAGTITLKLGSTVLCTSSSLVGQCDVSIPRFGNAGTGADKLTLEYSGNRLWNARTESASGTIASCIPFQDSTSQPAGSVAVTIAPAPNCDNGTGYISTTTMHIGLKAIDGYRLTGVGNSFAGRLQYSSDGASASVVTTPDEYFRGNELLPFSVKAYAEARCVPVTFTVTGLTGRLLALNMLQWQTQASCGNGVTLDGDNTVVASFRVGTQIPVRFQTSTIPERMMFYGWKGKTGDERFADRATFTVTATDHEIHANFGPVCYSGVASLKQPVGGTLTTVLPPSNCMDPVTGAAGWRYGTRASGELVDASTASRAFFESWTGDTDRLTIGTTTVRSTDSGAVRVRPFTFAITDKSLTVGATYGRCVALATSVAGDASEGVPGKITVNTAPNCPIGTGTATERWYRSGTSVELTTAPTTGSSLRFLGWSGLPIDRARFVDRTVTAVLDADSAATASYGTNANCRPYSISKVPSAQISLTTTFSLGVNACAAMYGDKFYDQGMSGNGILIEASAATPDAEGAEFVFAWATSPAGSPSGQAPSVSTVFSRTSQLNDVLYGNSEIIAYACEFVAVGANVYSPAGTLVNDAGASNISRESQSRLADFVRTKDADCSVGADPRSGYGGYAWVVGTQLLPVAVADPAAYTFTGWSGDVAGKGDTPDAALDLVGAGRRATGDNYHYRVVANYTAICHTLSLPSDADKVEVVTAPNCPGVDASQHQYLGGTTVVLHAPDKGDSLFRHWVSGTDAVDSDPRWASVVMTSDMTVIPYYSGKSAGEQLQTYGSLVGDQMAIASKKFVGVASAAMSAAVKSLVMKASLIASGIGYIAQGLELVGVHGAVIDGMKSASSAMTMMISLLWAPFDCITAWSAGGEDTAFYAAQNAIGTAIVSSLSAGANQQPASAGTSTLDQLKAQAGALKQTVAPARSAVQAISAAKSIYEASAAGNVGWEDSAYDAWASQNSVSIYSTCMANKAGGTMAAVAAVVP